MYLHQLTFSLKSNISNTQFVVLKNRVVLSSGGVVLVYGLNVNVSPDATYGRGRSHPWVHIPPQSLLLWVSQGEAKTMGKGFYVSKVVAIVGGVLAVGAVATIIALSIVYSQELNRNNENAPSPSDGVPTTQPTDVPTTEPSNELWDQYRLPPHLVPHTYHVQLWPRLTPDSTTGLYIFTGKAPSVKY